MATKSTFALVAALAILLPDSLRSQTTTPTESSLPGPCRSWLFPCGHGVWTCTTEAEYWGFVYGPQPGCPSTFPQTTAPPPGECQVVDGVCQFTNQTLECSTQLNTCQGYQCGSVSDNTERPPGCSFGGQYPEPDELCLPVNGSCQWYNPCTSWVGHCWSGYTCGSLDQYYQFRLGPQPICVPPPPGWVRPDPPGECTVMNGQCHWNNCTAWLDWCRTYWMCGTQYDEDVYRAGPPPPCPAPPPDYRPPPQPGMCQFNVLAGQCLFEPTTTTVPPISCPDGTEVVNCFSDPCGECPNYPNARCEANYCGRCSAVYYDENGNNVTDRCGSSTTPPISCPDGTEVVNCFSDPCGECPNYPNARCEANYCGRCSAVYYDENGNNVTDYCATYTGCEVILCSLGTRCVGNPVTGSAYCDPTCDDPGYFWCGDEQRCVLVDGDCPPNQAGPCPHTVQCVDDEPDPCTLVDCEPGYTCRVNPVSRDAECLPSTCSLLNCSTGRVCEIESRTGVAYCVASCEASNGGCRDDQLCRIMEYNATWCDPSPCRYAVCYNPPYVPCSSTNTRNECVDNSRCLVQNKTGSVACVQSCFGENGGCEKDQVCINAVRECNGAHYPYQCSSQVKCLSLSDVSPKCPAGWEYSDCGSNCGSTCEDVLAQDLIACPLVCYRGCFCPHGLAIYRDRCVDPKECYALINNPPAVNPLPVNSTTVLLSMTLPQMSNERFKNKTQQFLAALQQLFVESGYSDVTVTIHAVYFDQELQVVVQVSGNKISAAKTSDLVTVVSSNAATLPVQVKNVAAVSTQTTPSEAGGLSTAGTVSVIVVAVLVGLLVTTLMVIVVVVVLKRNTSKQIGEQNLSNDMIYSKLSAADETHVASTEDFIEDLQGEKVPL